MAVCKRSVTGRNTWALGHQMRSVSSSTSATSRVRCGSATTTATRPGLSDLLPSASGVSSTTATPTAKYAPPGTPRDRAGHLRDRQHPRRAAIHPTLLADDPGDESCSPEINQPGLTIARWCPQITNWHISKVTNRCHRSSQQPDQTRQTGSLRVPQLRELPNPGSPVCGETQLGPTRSGHAPTGIR